MWPQAKNDSTELFKYQNRFINDSRLCDKELITVTRIECRRAYDV